MPLKVPAQSSVSIIIEIAHRLSTILSHLIPSAVPLQVDSTPVPDQAFLALEEQLYHTIATAHELESINQLYAFLYNNPSLWEENRSLLLNAIAQEINTHVTDGYTHTRVLQVLLDFALDSGLEDASARRILANENIPIYTFLVDVLQKASTDNQRAILVFLAPYIKSHLDAQFAIVVQNTLYGPDDIRSPFTAHLNNFLFSFPIIFDILFIDSILNQLKIIVNSMDLSQERIACDLFSIILYHANRSENASAWQKAGGPILILELCDRAQNKGYKKLAEILRNHAPKARL